MSQRTQLKALHCLPVLLLHVYGLTFIKGFLKTSNVASTCPRIWKSPINSGFVYTAVWDRHARDWL